jgi:hypothetical protein
MAALRLAASMTEITFGFDKLMLAILVGSAWFELLAGTTRANAVRSSLGKARFGLLE